ncbi:amidohydrolase family protein [Dactylosporangium sp. AC04546]|uniref:amidohydrolase family protein n=1 Tax=Dactylosporangium sp. AC04546 TaxID=2862460 RepID=UPI001EDEAB46|nr:amidohydrolase family protein [Dactylosporangium sp. AC04546]WVK80914.1 amidohydrolase family protein [Dactylosporangium sp. AC04546]
MEDDVFIIDSLVHALNWTEENWADPVAAGSSAEAAAYTAAHQGSGAYDMPRELFLRDWTPGDSANLLFRESTTSVGVFNPQPLFVFKDGQTSVEKAIEAIRRYPTRFIGAYAAIDPLRDGWRSYLAEQVDALKPLGLKVYPASWQEKGMQTWGLNDPKVAFPLFEHALELGIRHIAIHKALPIGPMEYRGAFGPSDVEGAAARFPDIEFEIVHGGMSFTEETAWLLAKFKNVHINLENMNIVVARRPKTFAKILLSLLHVGGNTVYERIHWGTGTFQFHPRPCIESFLDFEFPEDLLEETGLYHPVEQITLDHKRDILGRNFARLHGLDIAELKRNIAGDEFSRPDGEPLPAPYSTLDWIPPDVHARTFTPLGAR